MSGNTEVDEELPDQAESIDRGGAGSSPPESSWLGKVPDSVLTVLVIMILLGFLEFAARAQLISKFIIAAPTDVVRTLISGITDGVYTSALIQTMSAMLIGFGISVVISLALAGILTSLPRALRVTLPILIALQALPMITVAPLVILWLGFGMSGKVTIVAISAFFPMFINALQGLRARDRDQVELMWSLGATRWQMLRYIRMPNSIPYLFAGFHVGIIFALIGSVVAEFVGSDEGLGKRLLVEKSLFNISGVYAILLIIMAFGIALYLIMRWLEHWAAPWAQDTSQTRL